MEPASSNFTAFETRIRSLERQLRVCLIVTIGLLLMLAGQLLAPLAQAQGENIYKAPAKFVDAAGRTVLYIGDWVKPGSPNIKGTSLTLYANGQPSASFVATGDLYKNVQDPAENYLNEVKTYLYEYVQGKPAMQAVEQEVSSLALTKAGGSLIVMARKTPPGSRGNALFAARLTAAPNAGGKLILYAADGTTIKTAQ